MLLCVPAGWVHWTEAIPGGAALSLPALIALCALGVLRAVLCALDVLRVGSVCPGCAQSWICVPQVCPGLTLCALVVLRASLCALALCALAMLRAPMLSALCVPRLSVLLGKPTLPVLCSLSLPHCSFPGWVCSSGLPKPSPFP